MAKNRRYRSEIQTPMDASVLAGPIAEYMTKEGFVYLDYKGAGAWKKGDRARVLPQYIIISYASGGIVLEAFVQGTFGKELGCDGFYGYLPKAMLRNRVRTLEQYIYSFWQPVPQYAPQVVPQTPDTVGVPYAAAQPPPAYPEQQPMPATPVPPQPANQPEQTP